MGIKDNVRVAVLKFSQDPISDEPKQYNNVDMTILSVSWNPNSWNEPSNGTLFTTFLLKLGT